MAPTVPSTTALPSTTTLPPLPAPPPGPIQWRPAGTELPRGFAIYTAAVAPVAGAAPVGVAWIDGAAVRLALYAGASEPYGSWPTQAAVAPAMQPALLAAFNSGFRVYAYRTGWYEDGRAAVPLQPGAASLVISADGSATVGLWGRDVNLTPTVVAVRQNLGLLVDGSAPVPAASESGLWGAVLGGGVRTWRSGLGVSASGDLVYAGGPGLTPAELAAVLAEAGAVRAMELDINPEWVSFATFTRTATGAIAGANLVPGMNSSPDHYLVPFSRDFLAVFSR